MSIKRLRMDLNFSRQTWMECPPRSRPIWLMALSVSSNSLTVRLGMRTPAMFNSDLSSRIVDLLTASTTFPLDHKIRTGIPLPRIWPRQ